MLVTVLLGMSLLRRLSDLAASSLVVGKYLRALRV